MPEGMPYTPTDYPDEPPDFRLPQPEPYEPPVFDESPVYEPAPYLPYQHPGALTAGLAPLANLRFGPGAPPWALILGGLLSGIAQSRVAKAQRDEHGRQEMNRRYGLAAAFRNRENLAESERVRSERTSGLKERSKGIEARKLRESGEVGLTPEEAARRGIPYEPGKRISIPPRVTTPLSIEDLGKRARVTAREGAKGRAEGAPPKPAALKFGPVIPSLSATSRDLLGRSSAARAASQAQRADSLQALAGEVGRIHAKLREAQSHEEVDAINVPDNLPPDIGRSLASALRLRKAQLGNPR